MFARLADNHCYSPLSTTRTTQRDVKVYGSAFALVGVTFLSVLFIGLQVEQWKINRLPDTANLYATEEVCGLDIPAEYFSDFLNNKSIPLPLSNSSDAEAFARSIKHQRKGDSSILEKRRNGREPMYPPLVSETYASAEIVRANEGIVQHCGNCGQCSNPQDLTIYDNTRNTLFKSSLYCSTHAFMFGRHAVSNCLQQAVGFTDGCNDCWVDNIMCDTRHCLFTCAWTNLVSKIRIHGSSENAPQKLNACLKCDERRCGPAFLKCAGANRRRAGILSDIQRNPSQMCESVDKDWWRSESIQDYYELTNRKAAP